MTMAIEELKERARGMMLGLAVGDALGAPVEFLTLARIKERYGPQGIRDFNRRPAFFTDDTQMSVAVAEALIDAGREPLDRLMAAVTRRFVEWLRSPENYRAPGRTCVESVKRLEAGVPWGSSGNPGSKGCGALMRTAPVGFFYQKDEARLREAALAIARSTHSHPASDAAALAGSYLVKLALDGADPGEWTKRTLAFLRGASGEAEACLKMVPELLTWPDEEKALEALGLRHKGWTAEEVAAQALFCVLKHPDDFEAAVLRAANTEGDSDSIACVAGAIAGARLGARAIPARWAEGVEQAGRLLELADRLAEARGG